MVEVAARIHPIPPDHTGQNRDPAVEEVRCTAEDYLAAVAAARAATPEGWRILHLRTVTPHPAERPNP